jgi:hypothetical protein
MNHSTNRPVRDQELEQDLVEGILLYLAEHPHSADTLEGIAEWWLPRQQVRTVVEQVASVLRRLTEQGLLEEIGAGPAARYRLKRIIADGGLPSPSKKDPLGHELGNGNGPP